MSESLKRMANDQLHELDKLVKAELSAPRLERSRKREALKHD